MSCVHYKFSSKLKYDTVTFDGLHISLCDLKKQIMGREKLKAADCDLQITNAQTKEGKRQPDPAPGPGEDRCGRPGTRRPTNRHRGLAGRAVRMRVIEPAQGCGARPWGFARVI